MLLTKGYPIQNPIAIAADGDHVWIANGNNSVAMLTTG